MNIFDRVSIQNKNNGRKLALSVAVSGKGIRSYTYDEMLQEADTFAKCLVLQGLSSGDRVALAAENSPEWVIALLAIHKIRCTAALIDASLLASDIVSLIRKSEVCCIFSSPAIMTKIAELLPSDMPVLNVYGHGMPFAGTAERRTHFILPSVIQGDEDIAAIIYSSGTTRLAEGIMHSHDALCDSTLMCAKSNKLTPDGRYLAVVPNSHIYGLICSILGPLLLGANVRFLEQSTPTAIKDAFTEYRPTIFPCVPKVYDLFMSEIEKKIETDPKTKRLFNFFFPVCLALRQKTGINLGKIIFKSIHEGFGGAIEVFCSAGAPMTRKTAEFYLGTGFNMLITYGATETNIPTLGNYGKHLTADSCGRRYPDVSVKISESGELLIKSPYMMKGYFGKPELTKDAFEDGWFKTGDLCQINAAGNYEIIGRSKENIVLASGKKITPEEVEKAYTAVTGIKELVVSGVPALEGNCDEAHAFVVCMEPGIKKQDILAAFQKTGAGLPAHMRISRVHFVGDIPRTSLQKPKRYLLRQMALQEIETEAKLNAAKALEGSAVSSLCTENVEEEVVRIIAEVGQLDHKMVTLQSRPFDELGIDSLHSIELAIKLQSRYGFHVDMSFKHDMTVADLVRQIREDIDLPAIDESSEYPYPKRPRDYRLFRNVSNFARFLYAIKVSNDKVIPTDSGYILCANHVTKFDYLWLASGFDRQRFDKFCCMAKRELLNKSHTSLLITRICGMIPVDRANFRVETMRCCKIQLKQRWGILIHPEGTRSEDGELGTFKLGAAVLAIETNVPIIPAYIHGAYAVFPKGSRLPKLFNFRKMRRYPVEVVYGNPVFPRGQTAEEMIMQVRDAVMELKKNITNKGKNDQRK